MYKVIIISLAVLISAGFESFGQKKKRQKDFFKFKNKKIEANYNYDTINVIDDHWFALDQWHIDSLEWEEQKELELAMRDEVDASQVVLHYNVPVEVSEQLRIDSVWVTLREYYSIWSSTDVNPYDRDGEQFSDTLRLPLTFEQPNLNWALPIPKMEVTSPFGLRRWKWHYGDDIRIDVGDSIRVAFDGIVRIAKYDRYGYGHYVMIRHYNGLETLYGHLSKRLVNVGDVIKAGDVLGLGGSTGRSTGPHLHFELRYEGNAFDPKLIFDFENSTILSDTLEINPNTFSYLTEARKIRYHRIRSGDTLSHISYRYGISINTICRLNGIRRSTILRIGQRLRIT